jgi:regulator of protease activity HflC (stomatin/prohibitin superfamily)
MKILKKYIVNEAQRGLLFKNQQFERVLAPGVYRLWDWHNEYQLQVYSLQNNLQEGVPREVHNLAQLHEPAFESFLEFWQTGEQEIGLVYQQDVLREIKAPGQTGAYWKTRQPIRVEKLDISEQFTVDQKMLRVLSGAREPLLSRSASAALAVANVGEGHVGFLVVDGKTLGTVTPGLHMWWKFNRVIEVKQFDLRLQNMEVNGQEILTKDRVSLRINLSVIWQIVKPETVKAELADAKDYLYRELQLALRTVVGTQTLDELLADKNSLNEQIKSIVAAKVGNYDLALKAVGARDIVLPGEMKAILTQVVEAQKLAEANLIKRQEETQATRSLHNTAKVMEGNPVLLRLKELEILEKITARINTLNVYGGLDGVMNDMVKLTERSAKV